MVIYKLSLGSEPRTTKNKSSKWPKGDSNPRPPDCESKVVTSWPHCLPVNNRFECTHYISSVFKAPQLLVSESQVWGTNNKPPFS